jgi:dipeptidase E
MLPGYAAEDGAALHFVGSELERVVTSRPRARAYRVEAVDGAAREIRLRARSLRDAPGLVAA